MRSGTQSFRDWGKPRSCILATAPFSMETLPQFRTEREKPDDTGSTPGDSRTGGTKGSGDEGIHSCPREFPLETWDRRRGNRPTPRERERLGVFA